MLKDWKPMRPGRLVCNEEMMTKINTWTGENYRHDDSKLM